MELDLDVALTLRALPIAPLPGGPIRVGAVAGAEGKRLQKIVAALRLPPGSPVDVLDWNEAQFKTAVLTHYRDQILDRTTYGLWRDNPDQSARQVVRGWQFPAVLVVGIASIACVVLKPRIALISLGWWVLVASEGGSRSYHEVRR